MIPAMDLTFARSIRNLLPTYLTIWCHPDLVRQGLTRAAQNIQQWNSDNPGNPKTIPSGTTDNNLGLPGIAVFRLASPLQEKGLLNIPQLTQGFLNGSLDNNVSSNFVSNVPVSCEYEIAVASKTELDRSIIERALWFSWANQPLMVPFMDAAGNSHTYTAPKYPMSSPIYSFENIEDTASPLMYFMNWKFRLDGKWFKSQSVANTTAINIDYRRLLESGDNIPYETEVITATGETVTPDY